MSYTFEITDKDGNCTEYKNIQKACYTIPVPNAKETATLEEKIVEITSEIENMESTLKALKAERKDLENQLRVKELDDLDKLMKEKGISFEKLKEMIG